MERITISVSNDFTRELTSFMAAKGYDNRSKTLRDLARSGLEKIRKNHEQQADRIAVLSYAYKHHTRELSKRLTALHHAHHPLHVSATRIHLDHDNRLEIVPLRGPVLQVETRTEAVISGRGIYHGHAAFIPVTETTETHARTNINASTRHSHIHPVA